MLRGFKEGGRRLLLEEEGALLPQHEADLERAVAKQVDRLIELGFPQELGKTGEEYRSEFRLPEDVLQPETYRGLFDILLVVEPRIPLPKQHTRARISDRFDTLMITNLIPVPDVPYAIWTHSTQRYDFLTVEQAISRFTEDEVASPQIEVTSLYLQHPEFFRDHGVVAVGSRLVELPPYLRTFQDGKTEVYIYSVDLPSPVWAPLSRGKEIIRLGVRR